MKKILIADKSLIFAKGVKGALSGDDEIRICEDGAQVLELCHQWQPDYMLLDLGLPKVDGLTILRTLSSTGQPVKTIAKTGCFQSDYVVQSLVRLGVHYILPDPCTVTEAVSQMDSLMRFSVEESRDAEDEIIRMLLHMGFNYSMNGFSCLCEALRVMGSDALMPVTKIVYPEVARVCGGTPERVERAVRIAISKAWKLRDDRIWQYYFAPGRDGRIPCPSNSVFLSRMVLCLKKRKVV